MPRVYFVKKARKDNSAVKAGESYYYWKFRYGGYHKSATAPRPSQLTQSPYYSAVRSLVEQIEDAQISDIEDVESIRDDAVQQIQDLGEQCQESLENIPENLQEAPTGQLLQERVEMCEGQVTELENIDCVFAPEDEDADEDELESERTDWISEHQAELGELVSECEV